MDNEILFKLTRIKGYIQTAYEFSVLVDCGEPLNDARELLNEVIADLEGGSDAPNS